ASTATRPIQSPSEDTTWASHRRRNDGDPKSQTLALRSRASGATFSGTSLASGLVGGGRTNLAGSAGRGTSATPSGYETGPRRPADHFFFLARVRFLARLAFAGPRPRRSASSSAARATVRLSTSSSLRSEALVVPS